jgi:F0F1-type ATP synthase assembly protein I
VASPKKTAAARFAAYSSLALALPASTLVGYLIGYWLDHAFGTKWLTVLFLLLGIAAGFAQLIRRIVSDARDGDA